MRVHYKLLNLKQLLKYHNDEVIDVYCKRCPDYHKNWSCPPHRFDEKEYLSKFKYFYILVVEIDLKSREVEEVFVTNKTKLGNHLLEIEKQFNDLEILFCGKCYICKNCNRVDNNQCLHEEKMRYSYESLGIKLSDLLESEMNLKLNWKSGSLKLISGVMFNHDNYKEAIENVFKGLKNELL